MRWPLCVLANIIQYAGISKKYELIFKSLQKIFSTHNQSGSCNSRNCWIYRLSKQDGK